jgi:hypothetical protein
MRRNRGSPEPPLSAGEERKEKKKKWGGWVPDFQPKERNQMVLGRGSGWFRVKEKSFLGFLFFCVVSPSNIQNSLYIGKILFGPQNWFLNFFFFVNLIFLNFFVFLKTSNINIDSMRKINDFKINALKVERVPNVFENLNSFETMLKMLKTMQMY